MRLALSVIIGLLLHLQGSAQPVTDSLAGKRRVFGYIRMDMDNRIAASGLKLGPGVFGVFSWKELSGYAQINGLNICLLGEAGECRVNGLSLGIILNSSTRHNGFQLASTFNGTKNMNGLQLAAFINFNREWARGLQLGMVNYSENTEGVQLGCYSENSNLSGLQLGIINQTENLKGVQVGLWNRNRRNWNVRFVKGLQLGFRNFTLPEFHGVQIGVFNKARAFRGVQIGLWNVNEHRRLPFVNWHF